MRPLLRGLRKAGHLVIPAALLATALALGLGVIRATGGNTDGNDVLTDHLARHPEEMRRFVKDYLAKNPQVLQEALVELLKPRLAPAADTAAAIKGNTAAVLNSKKRMALGNPNGDITMVEFVDYNCGFCKRALADMLNLMETDARLKVVLVEHPVLGATSVEAARISIALQMQSPNPARYLEFHRRLLAGPGPGPANKPRALALAAELGFDRARLEAESAGPEVDGALEESRRLARALGLRGTPSYIIGDSVLFGAVGEGALRAKIAAARQK
jgi:protein-disulfide isomerase